MSNLEITRSAFTDLAGFARLAGHWRRLKVAAASQSVFVQFTSSTLALNVSSLIGGTLAMRWVDPASIGVWQTLVLAQSWLLFVRLGVLNGMNRELPYLLGKGEQEPALRLAATAQLHAVACSGLAVLAFGSALWVYRGRGSHWRWALVSMAVLASTTFYLGYLQATFRSRDDFRRLGYLQFAQALTMLMLPLFAALWQFRGFCVHAALQSVVIAALAHRIRPLTVEMRWYSTAARLLLATGLPLFVSGYLHTVVAGLDRLILLQVAGVEALGYYAPAVAVVGAMSVLPNALATYLYPKLSYRLGKGHSSTDLWRTAASATLLSTLLALPLVAIVWMLAPTVVAGLIPAYSRGLSAVRFASVTGLASTVSACVTVLGTLKAWKLMYVYVAVLLGLKSLLSWFGAHAQDPVAGVAAGSMLASLIGGGIAIGLVYLGTHRTAHEPANA